MRRAPSGHIFDGPRWGPHSVGPGWVLIRRAPDRLSIVGSDCDFIHRAPAEFSEVGPGGDVTRMCTAVCTDIGKEQGSSLQAPIEVPIKTTVSSRKGSKKTLQIKGVRK